MPVKSLGSTQFSTPQATPAAEASAAQVPPVPETPQAQASALASGPVGHGTIRLLG